MKPSPYLDSLTPDKLQEVIDDLELLRSGYKLYFAIDPHEIFDYCFPIDPARYRSRDIDAIADDQAALHHVFYAPHTPPIILDVYVKEIRGLMLHFQHAIDEAYNETELVNKLINEVGLDKLSNYRDVASSQIVDIVENKFSVVLAVAMCVYSLGVERFREVCNKLLFGGGTLQAHPDIIEVFEDYSRSNLVDFIFQELLKSHTKPAADESESERRRRNSYVDALAIDQLIHVNTALQEKTTATPNATECQHLILYLSSAPRIKKIFDREKVKESLPLVNGKPFSFLRDRTQIFAYVVHKAKDDDFAKSIENLEKVKKLVSGLQKLERLAPTDEDYCSTCVLEGGEPHFCALKQTCLNVKLMYGPIKERRNEVRNLGLTKALDTYQHVLEAPIRDKTQKRFMEFFQLVNESQIRDLARERMLEKQRLIFMQSMTTAMWSASRNFAESHLREGRDTIVGTVQYLPLKPRIDNSLYSDILRLILNYYKTPPRGGKEKVETIDQAYRMYFGIDAKTENLDPEHEMVRCLLYLAFPSQKGDKRAYDHGVEMLKLRKVIDQKPYTEREYLYILAWAARRLKNFRKADEIATGAINQWSNDARFYHGRSLNKLAWWEANPKEAPRGLLETAIDDAIEAIRLYSTSSEENRELIAVNYNNIAYLYTLSTFEENISLQAAIECLSHARKALLNLKSLVKRDDWIPNHPEYFHTEALLEYQEFLFNRNSYTPKALIDKLQNARTQIIKACELNDLQLYSDLRHTIENVLDRLRTNER